MNPSTDRPTNRPARRKSRIALLLATGFGLGYIPKAPGTWGSILGIGYSLCATHFGVLLLTIVRRSSDVESVPASPAIFGLLLSPLLLGNVVAAIVGVYVAGRVAESMNTHDPQIVVIDEISGQSLTFLLNAGFIALQTSGRASQVRVFWGLERALNWKYLLAGFILFRVFDIWKPFPARQAESLNGGWGIMADDWIAAGYAATALWLLRWLGL
jgi:phosphatidylglycerophosphatase A